MITKICSKCKQEKSISKFYKGNDKSGYDYRCKDCHRQYSIQNQKRIISYRKIYNKKNAYKIALHDKIYRLTPGGIYSHLKAGAKIHKKLFKLNKQDFINWYNNQEQRCHYYKRTIKETNNNSNKKYDRLSVDRKDNKKGYIINNIVLSCMRCNLIKSNIFTYKQMFKIIKILALNGLKEE